MVQIGASQFDVIFRHFKRTLKCVAFCGKKGLSFQGHRDDSTASDSDDTGNFVQLVQFRAENDDVLNDDVNI